MKKIIFIYMMILLVSIVSAAIDDDLISYYNFSNTPDDSIDPPSNDGVINGGLNNGVNCLNPDCYFFPGSGDWITLSNSTQFDFERFYNFSFSFWVNVTSDTEHQTIWSNQGASAAFQGLFIFIYENVIQIWFVNDNGASNKFDCKGSTDIVEVDDVWHHIGIAYNGTGKGIDVAFYVDGSLETTTCSTDALAGSTLSGVAPRIGARTDDAIQLTGYLDELAVWNRTLTTAEMISLYNGGTGFFYPFISPSTPPVVAIISPPNNTINNSQLNVRFNYTDVDSDGANCTLYVNGTIHSNTSIDANETKNIKTTVLTEGNHSYLLGCIDDQGGAVNTSLRLYTLNSSTPIIIPAVKYSESYINDTEWFNVAVLDTSTIPGAMMWFFLFFLLVGMVIFAEYMYIPALMVLVGLLGMFYGFLIFTVISSIAGAFLIIIFFGYMIRGGLAVNE